MPRTSSAAFHAANVLFRQYDFVVRPPNGVRQHYDKLQATAVHAAIFIDYKTGIAAIASLRPELSYWQDILKTGVNDNHTAQQIMLFVGRVVAALERVPHFSEEETPQTVTTSAVSTAGAFTVQLNLSKAALEAMETLFSYYSITPKIPQRFADERITRCGVATRLEGCLQIGKCMKALPILRHCEAFLRKGQATPDDIVRVLRRVGILFEFLPSYEFEPGTMDRDETKLLA